MKRTLFVVVAGALAMVAGAASAADAQQPLAPVSVQANARPAVDCTPPTDSPVCTALHTQIRANFTPDEINMLFGAATPSLQYPSSYAKVKERYAAFLSNYETTNSVAVVVVGNPNKP